MLFSLIYAYIDRNHCLGANTIGHLFFIYIFFIYLILWCEFLKDDVKTVTQIAVAAHTQTHTHREQGFKYHVTKDGLLR